jgi:hypothetical protein
MFVQLYPAQVALVNGGANQVRSYAKEAAPADRTPVNGDGMSLPFLLFVVKLVSCVFKKLPALYIFQQCGMNLRKAADCTCNILIKLKTLITHIEILLFKTNNYYRVAGKKKLMLYPYELIKSMNIL